MCYPPPTAAGPWTCVKCGDAPSPPPIVSERGSLCDAISSAMLNACAGAFRLAGWRGGLGLVVFLALAFITCSSSRWTRAGLREAGVVLMAGRLAPSLCRGEVLASLNDLGWALDRFTSKASLGVWVGYRDAPLRPWFSSSGLALETHHIYDEANNSKEEIGEVVCQVLSPKVRRWLSELRQRAFTARLGKHQRESRFVSIPCAA